MIVRMSILAAALLCMAVPDGFATAQTDVDAAREAEQRRVEVVARAARSAVCVFSTDGKGGGSGVVVTPDGYALTNYHVASPCGTWMHCSMNDGRLYNAVLVGVDPVGDVALIKLLGRDDFPVAELADSDDVRVGDYCFAVGNPFLLATDFQPTVTWGIVSGVHRYQYPSGTLLEYTDCIQTDASINPGNSGGPLYNGRGQLIGINGRGSFEKRGRVNVGVGYAISINQTRLFWTHLASGRIVDHATLGATVTTGREGRVIVEEILTSSDAFRRGLRYGDEIISFGGRSIETVNEFKNVLGIFPSGWRVPLEYRRDGETTLIHVRLAGLHSTDQLVELIQNKPVPDQPDQPDGEPDKPRRQLQGSLDKKQIAVPDDVAELIVERFGYANYYFNQQRQQEIWSGLLAHGDPESLAGKWQITSLAEDGSEVRLVLDAAAQSGMQWDDGAAVLKPDMDLAAQLVPSGSGGALVALHLWQRLLTMGPEAYGEVFYLGQLPDSRGQLQNVLTGRFDALETQFMFDPDSGQLTALEMWSDAGQDPCELLFGDYRVVAGVALPHEITVRSGDFFHWQLQMTEFAVNDGP